MPLIRIGAGHQGELELAGAVIGAAARGHPSLISKGRVLRQGALRIHEEERGCYECYLSHFHYLLPLACLEGIGQSSKLMNAALRCGVLRNVSDLKKLRCSCLFH